MRSETGGITIFPYFDTETNGDDAYVVNLANTYANERTQWYACNFNITEDGPLAVAIRDAYYNGYLDAYLTANGYSAARSTDRRGDEQSVTDPVVLRSGNIVPNGAPTYAR